MARFLVEAYAPASGPLDDAVARARAVTEAMGGEGIVVQHLKAIHVPGDETTFHLFEGPSIEVICQASDRAGLTYARIVEALDFDDIGLPDALSIGATDAGFEA